jgi:hypothetical protein
MENKNKNNYTRRRTTTTTTTPIHITLIETFHLPFRNNIIKQQTRNNSKQNQRKQTK